MRTQSSSAMKSKAPEPPVKPKIRSLATIGKTTYLIPYLLEGDAEEGVSSEDNFIVALGPLKMRSYSNYEITYGTAIDITVSKILYVVSFIYNTAQEALDKSKKKSKTDKEEKSKELDVDEFGRIVTPFGTLEGSLERNIGDLCAYVLAQHGRIVGENADGTYELESITVEDVMDYLNPKALFVKQEGDIPSPFFEILQVSGLWDPQRVEDDLVENQEITDDELKN